MQTAPTPLDHMYAIVSLDILEMDKIAQVNLMYFDEYKKSPPELAEKEQLLHNGNQNGLEIRSLMICFTPPSIMLRIP